MDTQTHQALLLPIPVFKLHWIIRTTCIHALPGLLKLCQGVLAKLSINVTLKHWIRAINLTCDRTLLPFGCPITLD